MDTSHVSIGSDDSPIPAANPARAGALSSSGAAAVVLPTDGDSSDSDHGGRSGNTNEGAKRLGLKKKAEADKGWLSARTALKPGGNSSADIASKLMRKAQAVKAQPPPKRQTRSAAHAEDDDEDDDNGYSQTGRPTRKAAQNKRYGQYDRDEDDDDAFIASDEEEDEEAERPKTRSGKALGAGRGGKKMQKQQAGGKRKRRGGSDSDEDYQASSSARNKGRKFVADDDEEEDDYEGESDEGVSDAEGESDDSGASSGSGFGSGSSDSDNGDENSEDDKYEYVKAKAKASKKPRLTKAEGAAASRGKKGVAANADAVSLSSDDDEEVIASAAAASAGGASGSSRASAAKGLPAAPAALADDDDDDDIVVPTGRGITTRHGGTREAAVVAKKGDDDEEESEEEDAEAAADAERRARKEVGHVLDMLEADSGHKKRFLRMWKKASNIHKALKQALTASDEGEADGLAPTPTPSASAGTDGSSGGGGGAGSIIAPRQLAAACGWPNPVGAFADTLSSSSSSSSSSAPAAVDASKGLSANGLALQPFQMVGVNFLHLLRAQGHGCILADEMGLGKTVQVASFLGFITAGGAPAAAASSSAAAAPASSQSSGAAAGASSDDAVPCGPQLIVVPASVLGNWQRELGIWAPRLRVGVYRGGTATRYHQQRQLMFGPIKAPADSFRGKGGRSATASSSTSGAGAGSGSNDAGGKAAIDLANNDDDEKKGDDAVELSESDGQGSDDEEDEEEEEEEDDIDEDEEEDGPARPASSSHPRAFDVLLVTYNLFDKTSDGGTRDRAFLRRYRWDTLTCDEGHNLRDETKNRHRYLKALKARTRILLSGTPVQNTVGELFALLRFVMPTVFRHGAQRIFEQAVANAAEKVASERDKKAGGNSSSRGSGGKRQPKLMMSGSASASSSSGTGVAAAAAADDAEPELPLDQSLILQLRRVLTPFMLRRSKLDVLAGSLPPKTDKTLLVPPTSAQKELYESLLLDARARILGEGSSSGAGSGGGRGRGRGGAASAAGGGGQIAGAGRETMKLLNAAASSSSSSAGAGSGIVVLDHDIGDATDLAAPDVAGDEALASALAPRGKRAAAMKASDGIVAMNKYFGASVAASAARAQKAGKATSASGASAGSASAGSASSSSSSSLHGGIIVPKKSGAKNAVAPSAAAGDAAADGTISRFFSASNNSNSGSGSSGGASAPAAAGKKRGRDDSAASAASSADVCVVLDSPHQREATPVHPSKLQAQARAKGAAGSLSEEPETIDESPLPAPSVPASSAAAGVGAALPSSSSAPSSPSANDNNSSSSSDAGVNRSSTSSLPARPLPQRYFVTPSTPWTEEKTDQRVAEPDSSDAVGDAGGDVISKALVLDGDEPTHCGSAAPAAAATAIADDEGTSSSPSPSAAAEAADGATSSPPPITTALAPPSVDPARLSEAQKAINKAKKSVVGNLFTNLRKAASHPLLLRTRYTHEPTLRAIADALYKAGAFGNAASLTKERCFEELRDKSSDFDIHCFCAHHSGQAGMVDDLSGGSVSSGSNSTRADSNSAAAAGSDDEIQIVGGPAAAAAGGDAYANGSSGLVSSSSGSSGNGATIIAPPGLRGSALLKACRLPLSSLFSACKMEALSQLLQEKLELTSQSQPAASSSSSDGSGPPSIATMAAPKRGHRILIFSMWTSVLDILEVLLHQALSVPYMRLDGSTKVEERQALIDRFNTDPEVKVFLLSTKAGGLGLNLTAADTVILYDLSFNPQDDAQAVDRAHRLGQTRPVEVLRLVTSGTVDEGIYRLAASKRALDDALKGTKAASSGAAAEEGNDGAALPASSIGELLAQALA